MFPYSVNSHIVKYHDINVTKHILSNEKNVYIVQKINKNISKQSSID